MPMTTPARIAQGVVPNLRSTQYPMSAKPAVAPASSNPAPEYLTQLGNRRLSVTVAYKPRFNMRCGMIHTMRAFLKRPSCACEQFFVSRTRIGVHLLLSSQRSRTFLVPLRNSPSVSGDKIYRKASHDANGLSGNFALMDRKITNGSVRNWGPHFPPDTLGYSRVAN